MAADAQTGHQARQGRGGRHCCRNGGEGQGVIRIDADDQRSHQFSALQREKPPDKQSDCRQHETGKACFEDRARTRTSERQTNAELARPLDYVVRDQTENSGSGDTTGAAVELSPSSSQRPARSSKRGTRSRVA